MQKNNKIKGKKVKKFYPLTTLGVLLVLLLLVSCGGKQSQPEQAAAPVKKLEKKYDTLLFSPFTATPEIARDYPQAAAELQHSMMTALQMGNSFRKVDTIAEGAAAGEKTLLVKANITDMRIVGGAARFWGGVMAGSSGLAMDLQLIDGASDRVVRNEKLSSWNNPFGAAWTGGSTDNSLVADMGKISAQFIIDAMPAQ
jgi:hypothetical protein